MIKFKTGMIMKVASEYVSQFFVSVYILLSNQEGILISRPQFEDIPIPLKKGTILYCKLLNFDDILKFDTCVLEIFNDGYIDLSIIKNPSLIEWGRKPCILIAYPSSVRPTDRRISRRIHTDFKCQILRIKDIEENIKGLENFNGEVQNISLDGFYLTTSLKLELDEYVQLIIKMRDEIFGPLYAKVIRKDERGYGLQISSIFEEDREFLYNWISRYI
ncbi:MAG: PilZ domain-containing protein [Candidatus Hydrogenedentota bacterium]